MTVINPNAEYRPRLIELRAREILASYGDGSAVLDADASFEKGRRTVDAFIKPNGSGDEDKVIVTEERFRADAETMGPIVRESRADDDERQAAQMRMDYVASTSQRLLRELRTAIEAGDIVMKRGGPNDNHQLFYIDPETRKEMPLFLTPSSSPKPGHPLTFTSLAIDENGLRLVVTDPNLLNPLRRALNPWYQKQVAANLRLAKRS